MLVKNFLINEKILLKYFVPSKDLQMLFCLTQELHFSALILAWLEDFHPKMIEYLLDYDPLRSIVSYAYQIQ